MGRALAEGGGGGTDDEATSNKKKKKKKSKKRKAEEMEEEEDMSSGGGGGSSSNVVLLPGHATLLEICISCLYQCFTTTTTTDFLTPGRFHSIMPPLLSLLTPIPPLLHHHWDQYNRVVEEVVVPCIGRLAEAAGRDVLWKPMNHHLLMKTREKEWQGRRAALLSLHECFVVVGEEYLVMLPESISFLSELLEDDVTEVEKCARRTVKFIEELSGESLDSYLT